MSATSLLRDDSRPFYAFCADTRHWPMANMAGTASVDPRLLELISGKTQQPVNFSFNDTFFTIQDPSKSACLLLLFYVVPLIDIHAPDAPTVHVPLTHLLYVGISGSVIDVHVLVKLRSGFGVVKSSGSFQGDNADA